MAKGTVVTAIQQNVNSNLMHENSFDNVEDANNLLVVSMASSQDTGDASSSLETMMIH